MPTVLESVEYDCGHSGSREDAIEAQSPFWRSPSAMICPTCVETDYFECHDCDELTHNNDRNEGAEGSILCSECMTNFFTCSECEIIMHVDNESDESGICSSCSSSHEDEIDKIHEYSYKPRAKFNGEGPHYLGVELEIEVKRGELENCADDTLERLTGEDFVYLKHDGSINNGFEIVSHPSSLKFHRDKWGVFFDDINPSIRDEVTNCGLHVHTSRKCLSELTIGKMLAFVNSASNADFVKKLARRESTDYARLDPSKKVSSVKIQDSARYEAINLLPEQTIEFRLFKGTTKKEDFFLALEFVQCLIDFCKPSAHGIGECVGTEAFFKFVARLHQKKPISDEKIAKLGIDRKLLEKRTGSASHPYPYLAKFCTEYQSPKPKKAKKAVLTTS